MNDTIKDLTLIFDEAKAKNEFEFVMTLLNYKSIGAPHIQANLHEWFEAIEMYKGLYLGFTGKEKTRIAALLYSTFFENSDFYNIIGNLCRAILGLRATSYLFWKTKKYERLLGIGEKQDFLIELLNDTGKNHIIEFFAQNHHPNIRNTFFHSAYSLDGDYYILHDAEIQIGNTIKRSFNVVNFFYPIVDRVILFFETFRDLYFQHFNSYQTDKVIGNTPLGNNAVIIGTANGLGGIRFPNAVNFFGEWHDSGIWFDTRFGTFGAHNMRLDFPSIEKIEIDEDLSRYEDKTDIRFNDAAFFNLVDKVAEKDDPKQVVKAANIMYRIGEAKYAAMQAEENPHKKRSLPRTILPFYRRTLELLTGKSDTKALDARIKELEALAGNP